MSINGPANLLPMPLNSDIKFQKALALFASASNVFEAEAAELAARRLMAKHAIDPTDMPDYSLYNGIKFGGNALLQKLRAEWHEQHPPAVPAVEPPVIKPPAERHGRGRPRKRFRFNIEAYRKTLRQNRQRKWTPIIAALLLRPEGCEFKDVRDATGKRTMSMPRQARYAGLYLRIDKQPGKPNRYYGTPGATPVWDVPVKRPRRKKQAARQAIHDLIVWRSRMFGSS